MKTLIINDYDLYTLQDRKDLLNLLSKILLDSIYNGCGVIVEIDIRKTTKIWISGEKGSEEVPDSYLKEGVTL